MKKLIVLIAVLAVVPLAFADTFTLQNYTITANSTDPGLVINTLGVAGTPSFALNPGQSATFDLFQIWTSESTVNADDKVPQNIGVSFTFNPPQSSGTVNGTTDGVSLWGVLQYGQVTWNGPTVVNFNGGQYSFALSNATFNLGLFGLDGGQHDGATVQATLTFTQASTSTSVPEPASMLFLGTGLAGLAGIVRRRKS